MIFNDNQLNCCLNRTQKEKQVSKNATDPGQRLRPFNVDILSQTSELKQHVMTRKERYYTYEHVGI